MGVREIRAALQELHREQATLIRSAPVEWPEQPLDEKEFPLLLMRRGGAQWYRDGYVTVQTRMWHPVIFLVVKNQDTLALAENKAVDITQQLGEIYTDADNRYLKFGEEPCVYGQIIQRQQDEGINYTELGFLDYWSTEYYIIEFAVPIIEKQQPEES